MRLKLVVAALVCCFGGLPVCVGLQTSETEKMAFEVVSIKPFLREAGTFGMTFIARPLRARGTRFEAEMATVRDLIMAAYVLEDYQVVSLPSWADLRGDNYHFIGISPVVDPTTEQLQLMLQRALADRFH